MPAREVHLPMTVKLCPHRETRRIDQIPPGRPQYTLMYCQGKVLSGKVVIRDVTVYSVNYVRRYKVVFVGKPIAWGFVIQKFMYYIGRAGVCLICICPVCHERGTV